MFTIQLCGLATEYRDLPGPITSRVLRSLLASTLTRDVYLALGRDEILAVITFTLLGLGVTSRNSVIRLSLV